MRINLLMLAAPLYMLQVFDRVLTSRSVDTLLAEYDVEEERLLTDLEALLAEVSEKGLVTLKAGDAAT